MPDPIEKEFRNTVRLQRQANHLGKSGRRTIRRELLPTLYAILARHDPTTVLPRYQDARVAKLLEGAEKATRSAYRNLRSAWVGELVTLGMDQSKWAASLIEDYGPSGISTVSRSVIRKELTSAPMNGLTLREWVKTAEESALNAIRREVRNGVASGMGREAIRRQIAGPAMRTARQHIDAIARTAVTHTASASHMKTYQANSDVLAGVEFVATLDERTTLLCAGFDSKVWPVGSAEIRQPPLHVNCRSILTPVVDFKGLGIPEPKGATRASMDGPTSAKSYETWFRGLAASRQDRIIGPSRAKLFRAGEVTFRDMVARDGRVIPIQNL